MLVACVSVNWNWPGETSVRPVSGVQFRPLPLARRRLSDYVCAVSKLEELERVIERLPAEDLEKLSAWMARRRGVSEQQTKAAPRLFRDHSAFLNSYTPEDEGLYDDAQSR